MSGDKHLVTLQWAYEEWHTTPLQVLEWEQFILAHDSQPSAYENLAEVRESVIIESLPRATPYFK